MSNGWESPGISNELFDSLLGDILRYTKMGISELEADESMAQAIFMALWDNKERKKVWASVEIIDQAGKFTDQSAVMAAAGKMAVQNGQVPIAAWWVRSARMDMEHGVSHEGYAIIGRTDDGRVNGAFVSVIEDDAVISAYWNTEDLDENFMLDTKALDELFDEAIKAYAEQKLGTTSENDLAKQLFRKVGRIDLGG